MWLFPDCGAGVGRVTEQLLLHHFQEVDMLEPSRHLLTTAEERCGRAASASATASKEKATPKASAKATGKAPAKVASKAAPKSAVKTRASSNASIKPNWPRPS